MSLIASDKRIRLQCDSVFRGDKDYVVASDKCVRLQCDIVFEGETSFI